jgi:hypothetical protein
MTYSTTQIYTWICEALGRQPPGWHLPLPLLKLMARAGNGIGKMLGKRFVFDSDALERLVGSSWYDSGKIEREIGFSARVNLRAAIPGIARLICADNT